jgi:1-deoxy-D-xylulose-5-phosphate synthase
MAEAPRHLPLLDKVNTPADLRRLPEADLAQVADELRQETIAAVSVTGVAWSN